MQPEIVVRQPKVADALPDDLHPLLRRIYLNRGVGDAAALDLSLQRLLPYHDLKGIDAAVRLLSQAITEDQHILIVGDYDADGATSTALAVTALGQFGARRVSYLVPDRFRFGYGLTAEIVAVAQAQAPDLIITVDNGISSLAGVAAAQAAGIKVLVTDHHLPGSALPEADAIVNPNQPGCAFASKQLAGVGVIFYVMAALRAQLREQGSLRDTDVSLAPLLDLVALGTVADVVPLDHNNRILVHQGLQRIRAGQARSGIQALIRIAGRNCANLTASDLGFALGPRLNAAGRLQDMSLGIECLLCSDAMQAGAMAQSLDEINRERRQIQQTMEAEALATVEAQDLAENSLPGGLCVFDQNWHEGIVGLVASRLKERHHRPCVAFARAVEDGLLKGSARSIPGLHIRDVLARVASLHPGLIEKFGGHAMAAGLSLRASQLQVFRQAFQAVVGQWTTPEMLHASIETEGELDGAALDLETAELLARSGPWGQGFPEPLFHGVFEVAEYRVLKEQHLKLRLLAADGSDLIDAIAFNQAAEQSLLGASRVAMVYRLDVNEYRGRRTVQLRIEQFSPA